MVSLRFDYFLQQKQRWAPLVAQFWKAYRPSAILKNTANPFFLTIRALGKKRGKVLSKMNWIKCKLPLFWDKCDVQNSANLEIDG